MFVGTWQYGRKVGCFTWLANGPRHLQQQYIKSQILCTSCLSRCLPAPPQTSPPFSLHKPPFPRSRLLEFLIADQCQCLRIITLRSCMANTKEPKDTFPIWCRNSPYRHVSVGPPQSSRPSPFRNALLIPPLSSFLK